MSVHSYAEELKRQSSALEETRLELGAVQNQLTLARSEIETIKAVATVSENTKQEAIDQIRSQWQEEVASLQAIMKGKQAATFLNQDGHGKQNRRQRSSVVRSWLFQRQRRVKQTCSSVLKTLLHRFMVKRLQKTPSESSSPSSEQCLNPTRAHAWSRSPSCPWGHGCAGGSTTSAVVPLFQIRAGHTCSAGRLLTV